MTAEYDAFFSYRRKDLDRARPLLDALDAVGVRVWRDQTDLPDAAPITQEIRNAIAHSRALIAFYSVDYPLSSACFEELSTAWMATQQLGEVPYTRILVLNPELEFDHIALVLREQQSFRWPTGHLALEDLALRIREQLDRLVGTLHTAATAARPTYFGMSPIAAARFEGRPREFWELHGKLTANRLSIISGVFGQPTVQVRGIGGNGKSMLAREYAIRFGAAYPGGVFWLNAHGNDASSGLLDEAAREALRRDQLRNFAARQGIPVDDLGPEQVEAAFWRTLAESGRPCLWIVDDLASGMGVHEFQARWTPPWSGASLLVTTRTREYNTLGSGLDLGMLTENEALRLLTRGKRIDSAEQEAATKIVRELGYHPLAVEVAGSYLARGIKTYYAYLVALSEPDSDAEDLGVLLKEVLPTGHDRSISSTLKRSVRLLGADALAFLQLASTLATDPIPQSLVEAVFREFPEPRPDAMIGMDEADSLGLTSGGDEDARSVHTLISRTVRRLSGSHEGHPPQWVSEAAVRALLGILPGPVQAIDRHVEIRRELVHARHLVAGGLRDNYTAALAAWLALHDAQQGQFARARGLQEKVLEANRQLLGPQHPATLRAMSELARTLGSQNELALARGLQEQVVEDRGCLTAAEQLVALGDLAMTICQQGEYATARELQEGVCEAGAQILGAENPVTLTAISNLAQTVQDQGDLPLARKLQEKVAAIEERLHGARHPRTLLANLNLAGSMFAQGDLSGAQELQRRVLEARRMLLGPEHPHTALAANNLGLTLNSLGQIAEASSLLQYAVENFRRRLGPEHPETLTAMSNLAQCVKAQGDKGAALNLQKEVLQAFQKRLGPKHPLTLTAMLNVATTAFEQGNRERARELMERVLKARHTLLGTEHTDTTVAAWNLLDVLIVAKKLKRARSVAKEYLLPLMGIDTAGLSSDQRRIVEMLPNTIRFPET